MAGLERALEEQERLVKALTMSCEQMDRLKEEMEEVKESEAAAREEAEEVKGRLEETEVMLEDVKAEREKLLRKVQEAEEKVGRMEGELRREEERREGERKEEKKSKVDEKAVMAGKEGGSGSGEKQTGVEAASDATGSGSKEVVPGQHVDSSPVRSDSLFSCSVDGEGSMQGRGEEGEIVDESAWGKKVRAVGSAVAE